MSISPSKTFNSDTYSLTLRSVRQGTKIDMNVKGAVNTREIPETYSTLKKLLPNIFLSECFNDEKLPFRKEVKETEIGHLFEHILLEELCRIKGSKGFKKVVFSGVTKWNWLEDQFGTFHIEVDAGFNDFDVLEEAVDSSLIVFNQILAEPRSTLR